MVLIQVFQKVLPATAPVDRLSFPASHLHVLPFRGDELRAEFQVSPCGNARPVWTLCCTRRGLNNPRAVITRATWSQILEHGHLQAGDRLTFYIDDEESPRYKIMVERIGIKLFGEVIHHPDGNWVRLI